MAAGWTVRGAASVIGSAHELDQTPCQDTHIVRASPSGAWTGVVVCDGAGSAKFSKTGAEVASTRYADKLIEIAIELEKRAPGAWINDALIEGAVHIRQELRDVARQDDIQDYHTTLLAVLVGPTGGVCVHIGDGAIFGGRFRDEDGSALINADWFLSEPENGEYANETYFITEAGWIKHLRISPLPPLDWIALATDGGAALALTQRNELKAGFMPWLLQELRHERIDPSLVIQNALSDPAFASITGDDKTLAVLVRGGMFSPHPHSLAITAADVTKPSSTEGLEEIPAYPPEALNTHGAPISHLGVSLLDEIRRVLFHSKMFMLFISIFLLLILFTTYLINIGNFYNRIFLPAPITQKTKTKMVPPLNVKPLVPSVVKPLSEK